ncbi:MAG: hypothetical protein ACLQG3_09885 [Terracidiphilus sp.]
MCAVLTAGTMGCGGKNSTTSGVPANITGNWEFTANLTTGGTAPIAVYLTSNAGSVSGIAMGPAATDNVCSSNGCCGSPIGFFSEALTGTVDADGNLKLGTAVAGNPAFSLSATVSGSTMTNGSFTLSGSCTTQGTVTGIEYPALNGTYSGTLASQITGQSFTVSVALDQSSAPNSYGYLGLGGTVNVTGYSCISSGGATPISLSASYIGNYFGASLTPASSETLGLLGTLSPDGKTLDVTYDVLLSGSSCNLDYGSGTLTLQ